MVCDKHSLVNFPFFKKMLLWMAVFTLVLYRLLRLLEDMVLLVDSNSYTHLMKSFKLRPKFESKLILLHPYLARVELTLPARIRSKMEITVNTGQACRYKSDDPLDNSWSIVHFSFRFFASASGVDEIKSCHSNRFCCGTYPQNNPLNVVLLFLFLEILFLFVKFLDFVHSLSCSPHFKKKSIFKNIN